MSEAINGAGIELLIIAAAFLVLTIVLFVMLLRESKRRLELEERLDRFMAGSDGESLEDQMIRIFDEHDALYRAQEANRQDIDGLQDRLRTVIQKVGVVKYDAFEQMGGNLSSAIVMLDEDDNGFIINTVQSVDGCYSYVKEIRDGRPDVDLGKEEQQAMEIALSGGTPGETYVASVHDRK